MLDPRDARGVVAVVARRLDAFNRRHPWSHNDHFHGWILRHLPDARRRALDVGCGRGELVASLRRRFVHVDGVDADAGMARIAASRFTDDPGVSVRHACFDEVSGRYDLITMVAVLHHLDLAPALRHVERLLEPGGRLLVVGLSGVATPRDLAWDLASAVLNPVVGMAKHPHRAADPDAAPPFPVADPTLTFDEIEAVATRVLPEARMRRRLFFRYSLEWTRPKNTAE